jgi:hypothetical protein
MANASKSERLSSLNRNAEGETSMKAIKAAAVQAAPVYLNLDASIAKAAESG